MSIFCKILNGTVEVYRGNELIATVVDDGSGDPKLVVHGMDENMTLSFNEIAMIQDDWNFMLEKQAELN